MEPQKHQTSQMKCTSILHVPKKMANRRFFSRISAIFPSEVVAFFAASDTICNSVGIHGTCQQYQGYDK